MRLGISRKITLGLIVLSVTVMGLSATAAAAPRVAALSSQSYIAHMRPGMTANLPHGKADCVTGWTFIRSEGKHWTHVGSTYVPDGGATQKFTYGKGQSSQIGFAESTSTKAGTFSEDGTDSWSTSSSEHWPTYHGHRSVAYWTEFKYGLFKCLVVGRGFHKLYYRIQVNGFAGGTKVTKPKLPVTPAKYCDPYIRGSGLTLNYSTAVTYGAAVSIPVAGLTLSAQTGYDTNASIDYEMSAKRWLCGQHDDPGGSPGNVVVLAKKGD